MRNQARKIQERICALVIALALVLSNVLPQTAMIVKAADGEPVEVTFVVQESQAVLSGAKIVIQDSTDPSFTKEGYTDADGKCTIELVEGRTYNYTVTKDYYGVETGSVNPTIGMNDISVSMRKEVTGITLSPSSAQTIPIGETCQFTAITSPTTGKQCIWKSSNESVATVNGGTVTGRGAGTAEITASYGDITSSKVMVTVNKKSVTLSLGVEVIPSGNKDAASVKCTVTGAPAGATLKYSANGEVFYTGTNTTQEYPNKNDNLIGNITFKVEYAGDDTYDTASVEKSVTGLHRTQQIVFEDGNSADTPKIVTRSSEGMTFSIGIDKDNSKISGDISYTTDSDLISVNESGEVTVEKTEKDTPKSGLAKIKVTAAENGNWESGTADYYVYVQEPVNVEELKENFTTTAGKTYDREKTLDTVTASIAADQLNIYTDKIDTTKPVEFTFSGTVDRKDAGTYDKVTLGELEKVVGYDSDGTEVDLTKQVVVSNYKGAELNGTITIKKKTITLGTENATVEYAKDAKTVQEQVTEKTGLVSVIEIDEAKLLSEDGIDVTKFKAMVTPPKGMEESGNTVGTYSHVIQPNVEELNESNYDFVKVDNENALGNLEVTPATLSGLSICDIIKFNSDENSYMKDEVKDKVWISGGTLKVEISENSAYKKFFDAVTTNEGENLTADGYVAKEDITYNVTKEIYLSKDGNRQTQGTQDIKIIVDRTAPGFTFGRWGEGKTVESIFNQIVTFNKYKKTEFTLEGVEAHDDVTVNDGQLNEEQSGVKEWKYLVFHKKDQNADITKKELEDYAKDGTWRTSDDGTIPVAVLSGDTKLADIEGNYIVLVNVMDNVGNQVTLTSEGMILDYKIPTVTISGVDSDQYYKDDVPYTVKLKDETIASGFKSAKIEIFDGEELKKSYEYNLLDDEPKAYTLSEIKERAERELTQTPDGEPLKVNKDYNSNNLVIKVTAIDQADNEATATQRVMVDSKAPEISVKYSSKTEKGETVTAQNDKYYKAPRTMEITYTEKNFDPDKVTFDVKAGSNIASEDVIENVKVSALGTYGIAVEKDFVDSESDKNVESYTDDRTNTLTLVFNEDNEYYIVPHCTDKAGNSSVTKTIEYSGEDTETAKTTFVIDQTAPVLDVTFAPITPGTNESSRVYTQENVTATVAITEKNFWLPSDDKEFSGVFGANDPMNFDATSAKNYDGKEVPGSDVYDIAKDVGNWSQNGIIYENKTFKFENDANYIFGFTYTDLAGNSATYDSAYFTVDDTKPTGSVSLDTNVWENFFGIITWGLFKNSAYDVTMTSEDETAGVETTEYYYHRTTADAKETLSKDDLEQITNWTTYKPFQVKPNEQFVIYEKVTDKAKNVEYFSSNGAIADDQNPTIDVKILSKPVNGIYNADVKVQVDARDPRKGDTFSGLKYVWYQIEATGNVNKSTGDGRTPDNTLKDNSSNAVQDEANEEYHGTFDISAKDFNSNDVKLRVHAVDFAGNEYTNDVYYKNPLKIDVTKPVIENITWNTSDASNGKYYNVTRVATITVRERNFDPNQVRLNITNDHGTPAQVSSWKVDTSGTSDNNINTCTVTFANDGDYNMNVSCTDKAGWASNTQTVEEFTIDKTVPVINVTFDNNNARNGKYYNASRTATVTVNEHNFNGADVQTAITSNTTAPRVNGWSGGDVHSATIPFTADGEYAFTVNYTDLAGNPAQVVTVDQFVIDQTKPEIEIFDIEDKSANNGEVAPGVRYSDTNHDVNGVSITYSGAKHAEKAVDGARSSIPNGESIKMADFEHTQETDDVYTMVAKVTDLAGNFDEKTVTFSVNRFGSNFLFSDATEKFLEDYYNNAEEDLVVTEINVDTLVHRGITCGHDGNTTDFEEGTDYTVRASGTEASWKSYQYTISKKNFEKEGLYNITIDSVDRATNEVNNKIKEADIEFVIDKTAPTVVINGIENDGQYRENSRDITIAAQDNVAMNNVDLYVDDDQTSAESYNADAIKQANGELVYTLGNSSDWQKVKAVAVDMAGNVTDTSKPEGQDTEEWISVLVTSNLLVQFYRNTPLFIGSTVGLVALIAFLIFFFKRRKEDEEEAAE